MAFGELMQGGPTAGIPLQVALRAIVECAHAEDCTSDLLASLIEPLETFAARVERVGTGRVSGQDRSAGKGLARAIMHLGKERVALLALVEVASLGAASERELGIVKAKFDAMLADEAVRSFVPQVIRASFSGKSLEFVRESNRAAVAFLYDSKGNRLLSHRFDVDQASLEKLLEALCLELARADEIASLRDCLVKLAA